MPDAKSRVQAVSKVFDMIEALANCQEGELSLAELADALHWNRTTVYRFIQTLIDIEYVQYTPKTEKYHLTFKIVGLANRMVNQLDIRKISHSYMVELADTWQLNVHLGLIDGNDIVFIEHIDYDQLLGTKFNIGRRSPVHATAIGKVILSTWNPKRIEAFLKNYQFTRCTPKTIVDKDLFVSETFKISQTGYAQDQGECNYDVYCIAAPIKNVHGEAIAGISLSGSESQIHNHSINELGESIKVAARKISANLGHNEG